MIGWRGQFKGPPITTVSGERTDNMDHTAGEVQVRLGDICNRLQPADDLRCAPLEAALHHLATGDIAVHGVVEHGMRELRCRRDV